MKKVGLGIIASCLLALSLTACSNGSSNGNQAQGSSNESQTSSESNENTSSSGGKKTIVYHIYSADEQLKETIKKYEALHPNIEIKLETAPEEIPHSPEEAADLENKYRKPMDTALLAGKGPDLIDSTQLEPKYVKHNLFVNLSEMMEQDSTFKKEDYFSNILDNSRDNKGGLYKMPLGFSLIGFYGDQDAIAQTGVKFDDNTWTWDDFRDISNQLVAAKGKYSSVISDDPRTLMNGIIKSNFSLFIDKATQTAHFDSPEFRDLLKQVKMMKDEGIISGGKSYFVKQTQIGNPLDYLEYAHMFYENGKFYTEPHPAGMKGGYFNPSETVSINANSKVKQEAWDFLKFMMSEESQNTSRTANIPINKQAVANQLKQLRSEETYTLHYPRYKSDVGRQVKIDKAKLDEFESLINEADLEYHLDYFVDSSLFDELDSFFTGQKSLDAVVKIFQDKATTYLNE